MKILQFVTEALGDNSYLVVAGEDAAVVDPQRDIAEYVRAAREHGAEIRRVFETHVHNDYLSGGPELVALGAEVVAPAQGKMEFPHMAVGEGDVVDVGAAKVKAIAAPGHTYEHTAYIALDGNGQTLGAFTGGAVLIGSAGRSDLLGPDHTEELTRLQWETGQRLAGMLPASAEVLPTHGAGSFCSSTGAGLDRRAALAEELTRNPVLEAGAFEVFRALHLSNLPPIPAYYRYMAPVNRKGAEVRGGPPEPAEVAPDAIEQMRTQGVAVIDARARGRHAEGHIPGSIGVEDCGSFVAYVSWVVPFNAPIVLVTEDERQAKRLTTDLWRIGYERVEGFLAWPSWERAGGSVVSTPVVTLDEARGLWKSGTVPMLDVRFAYEQVASPVPGAIERTFDSIRDWADSAGPGPVLVVCASGQRAATAASVLGAKGVDARVLIEGAGLELVEARAAS